MAGCEAGLTLGCSRSSDKRYPEKRPMRSEVGEEPIPLGLDNCYHEHGLCIKRVGSS